MIMRIKPKEAIGPFLKLIEHVTNINKPDFECK